MKGILEKVRRSAALCACLTAAVGALVGCGGGERDDSYSVSVPAAETSSELPSDGSESSEAEKVYTITYDLGVNRYATLKSESTKAVFGGSFTLEIPEYEGSAAFYGWYLADENGDATDVRVEDGVYTYTRDILVVARWQEWSDVVS